MPVYAAAIAAVLFYTCAIPVKLAFAVHIGGRVGFGAGMGIFRGARAGLQAELRARGELPPRRRRRKKGGIAAALRPGMHLLRHMRLEYLHAGGRLCLPDAAQTALICGGMHMIEGMLVPLVPGRVRLRPVPDFSAGGSDLIVSCMVSLRAGHIICAALIGAWTSFKRRISHGKASD